MVAKLNSVEVYNMLTDWAEEYDEEFFGILTADPEYTKSVLAIDRDVPKPRKDIAKWNEVKEYFSYMFDALFVPDFTLPENINSEDAKAFLTAYKNVYNPADDRQEWFQKIKDIAPTIGFAAETKEYKANRDNFKGHAGDLSSVLRIAVTGRRNTPDLCSIMQVLGKDKCIKRIDNMLENI